MQFWQKFACARERSPLLVLFPADEPIPTGVVLHGVDGMIAELERRKRVWSNLRYRDLKEPFLPDFVVQTFFASGTHQDAGSFDVAAVDLYSLKAT